MQIYGFSFKYMFKKMELRRIHFEDLRCLYEKLGILILTILHQRKKNQIGKMQNTV